MAVHSFGVSGKAYQGRKELQMIQADSSYSRPLCSLHGSHVFLSPRSEGPLPEHGVWLRCILKMDSTEALLAPVWTSVGTRGVHCTADEVWKGPQGLRWIQAVVLGCAITEICNLGTGLSHS